MPVLDDVETYIAGLGRSTRKGLRRDMRAAKAAGIETRVITEARERVMVRKKMLGLYAEKWATAKTASQLTELVRRYDAFLKRAEAIGALLLLAAFDGARMVCATAHVADEASRTMISLLEGRVADEKRFSPGMVLHLTAMEYAIANGFETYDMGYGNSEYKYQLGATDTRLGYVLIDRSDRSELGLFDAEQVPAAMHWSNGCCTKARLSAHRPLSRRCGRSLEGGGKICDAVNLD
ncbi:acetyltransferase (GNAT) family protein [Shimia abyssi]|uniref:Acetyltransferase (GNAT) family protein n=2 Tax=Shimia abyssi TaxID=1662395 RepID=A0A2P8F611_9RHOB|nr:acetyltransferase (GNAT) family protein [Shimia abyssi]